MLNRLTLLPLALFALPVSAETEAGLLAGYNFMSASSGGNSEGGLMAGVRGGFRTASGLVIDAQVTRHSTSSEGLSTAQFLAGVGARYHFADAEFSPFISAHLNHHLEAHVSGGGGSAAIEGSSGLGMDVGGGAQLDLNGAVFAEAIGHYAMQFSGDIRYNSLGMGVGIGVWF